MITTSTTTTFFAAAVVVLLQQQQCFCCCYSKSAAEQYGSKAAVTVEYPYPFFLGKKRIFLQTLNPNKKIKPQNPKLRP
jgi:hypothetical protein